MPDSETISTPILPFATVSTPPAPLIVLLDLTDLHAPAARSLLALEILEGAGLFNKPSEQVLNVLPATVSRRYNPYTLRGPSSISRANSSPLSSAPSLPQASPAPPSRPVTTTAKKVTIERPKNASRMNLENLLQWEPNVYKDFRAEVTILSRKHLDSTCSFKDQDTAKLEALRLEVLDDFPILQQYQQSWPLDIAIIATLKSSAALSKKKTPNATAGPSS